MSMNELYSKLKQTNSARPPSCMHAHTHEDAHGANMPYLLTIQNSWQWQEHTFNCVSTSGNRDWLVSARPSHLNFDAIPLACTNYRESNTRSIQRRPASLVSDYWCRRGAAPVPCLASRPRVIEGRVIEGDIATHTNTLWWPHRLLLLLLRVELLKIGASPIQALKNVINKCF